MVFIPKPGKPSFITAKDFRPISLTSFVLKTIERLIHGHTIKYLEANALLSKDQHAYRKGHSTETALQQAVSLVEKQIENGGYAVEQLLDIEGAFNHTNTDIICNEAYMKGINGVTITLIRNMLTNREVYMEKGTTTVRAVVDRGCPQGRVLLLLLWLIVVDGLLKELRRYGFNVIGYAECG